MIKGIVAVTGYAHEKSYLVSEEEVSISPAQISPEQIDKEVLRFFSAKETAVRSIDVMRTTSDISEERDAILTAHQELIKDVSLEDKVIHYISKRLYSAERATYEVFLQDISIMATAENEYLRGRIIDLKDVCRRIILCMQNKEVSLLHAIEYPCILVAKDILPSHVATLDVHVVKGIVLEMGCPYSHATIISRALDIPMIVGVFSALRRIPHNERIILDALAGKANIYLEKEKDFEECASSSS